MAQKCHLTCVLNTRRFFDSVLLASETNLQNISGGEKTHSAALIKKTDMIPDSVLVRRRVTRNAFAKFNTHKWPKIKNKRSISFAFQIIRLGATKINYCTA